MNLAGHKREIYKSRYLYIMMILPILYLIIFKYVPMYGIILAFKDYDGISILSSPWIGFKNFIKYFHSYQFGRTLQNTISISLLSLLLGFPIPIILALSLNNTRKKLFKKSVQMITYLPHFISIVVISGIIINLMDPRYGLINRLIEIIAGEDATIDFLGDKKYFYSIIVFSDIWQGAGWNSIIYLAALSTVDEQLHEAAMIDGAGRLKRMVFIDIPMIIPTAIILLILRSGRIMNLGFQKILLLQNPLNLEKSEVIQTFVYKTALQSSQADFDYATAVGLFLSLTNLCLILLVNHIAKKAGETSIF